MVEQVHIPAVLVAAVSSFMVGGLWYSDALFLKSWTRANGVEKMESGHPAKVFGISFLLCVAAAWAFAWFLGPEPPLAEAMIKAAVVGVCFVGASFGVNYQFSNRPTLLWLIDGGYHLVQFLLFGLILGLWH